MSKIYICSRSQEQQEPIVNQIKKIYIGDKSILKIYLGNGTTTPEQIFFDDTAAPWGRYIDEEGEPHPQGTLEQIEKALEKHKNGIINLFDEDKYPGWAIGTERTETLSSIPKKGLTTMKGTQWVFKGRKGTPFVIDTDSLPDFTTTGEYWKINFKWRRVLRDKKTKKLKKKWVGSFNGIAKVSGRNNNGLFFLKVKDSSHTDLLVYKNSNSSSLSTTKGDWLLPKVTNKDKYNLVLYKVNKKEILSPYQKIKITGGEDIDNPEFVNWLKSNATCRKYNNSLAWDVPEAQSSNTVHLILSHKFDMEDSDTNRIKTEGVDDDQVVWYDGFTIKDDEEGKPSFIISQKELLPSPGYLLKKKVEEKDKNGKTVTTYKSSNTGYWGSTVRRDWLNEGYFQSLPEGYDNILQDFTWKVGTYDSSTKKYGLKEYTDTVALPLSCHLNSHRSGSSIVLPKDANNKIIENKEEVSWYSKYGSAWQYYENNGSSKKPVGVDKNGNYWTASASIVNNEDFVFINAGGKVSHTGSKTSEYFAPFMVI